MALVLAFRMPASSEELGAGVRFEAQAPGELHVPDAGAFLAAPDLRPGGGSARGALPVRNVTRGPVEVRLRARRGGSELDRAVHVELLAGKRRLASGPLARLRTWSRTMLVERGAERTIEARAWIPAGTSDTEGRRVTLDLELDANLVRTSNHR